MERDLLAHDEGFEDVSLDLADECDADRDDEGLEEPAGGECDDGGDDHGEWGADQGDEGADEHEDGERSRQGNPHHQQQDEREDAVHGGDDHGSPRVPREGVPAGARRTVDAQPVAGGQLVQEPEPHPLPGREEEDRHEQAEREHGEDQGHGARVRDHLAGEVAGVALHVLRGLADEVVDPVVDLVLGDVPGEGPVLQEVEDRPDALFELSCQPVPLPHHRADHVRQQAREEEEGQQQGEDDREGAGHDPVQEVRHRVEDRGEDEGHEHGDEDELDARGGEHQQRDHQDDADRVPRHEPELGEPGGYTP